MLELPETHTLASQIQANLVGRTITQVIAAQSPHKFAWYHGNPATYPARLIGNTIQGAEAHGMFIKVQLDRATLLFSDGVNLRWHPAAGPVPAKHQLLLAFDDSTTLCATVGMYGGLQAWAKSESFENPYYTTALEKPSPLSEAFNWNHFSQLMADVKVQQLSVKAALATEQRIPGLGNGCLQDILWFARLNPHRKVNTLSAGELKGLYESIRETLLQMTQLGGRSTEKDLFGKAGGYPVELCATNAGGYCSHCGGIIIKEAYMGGSVYYCGSCQPR
ncbi:MAG: DNA-formamidopyrimidine glycosylase family protein [Anaerolineaceae bacterium]|nr:DNA-formamidopyrimidine glycosylase family protein [Anaerolineaceae bacterium]